MTTINSIGKAIWRKPNETAIWSISSDGGEGEFIIAPFSKNEDTVSIKGTIKETGEVSIADFFMGIKLSHAPKASSTPMTLYIKNVGKAVQAINNKQFEKVVLARQYFLEKHVDVHKLFLQLTVRYKSAFVYCFALEDGTCMLGATPETLLIKQGNKLTTEALGGTEQSNGYSKKEHNEHRQIITYISNKLDTLQYAFNHSKTKGKIAGNVSHLSTMFNADSKNILADMSLLEALHPTSAVCGLPFLPACDFINQHEDFNRHYYAGYLGIKQAGDFNFYVNLRCAEIFEGCALLFAGAGINMGSIPEKEWEETGNKLDTLLALIR